MEIKDPQTDQLEKELLELKNKIREYSHILLERIEGNCRFALRLEEERGPDNKEYYHHDGVAREGLGISVLFKTVFYDELQEKNDG